MTIADAIRANDLRAYQQARYLSDNPVEDGEELLLENEDFSGVDFSLFSMGFTKFVNCNLDTASNLYGQPILIENSSAKELDMRGLSAIIIAKNVDLSNMQIDKDTHLAYGNGGKDAKSELTDCIVDPNTKKILKEQGVSFL